jgi:hypothetical protein
MARTTCTQSALEIDSSEHNYQTHAGCQGDIRCIWACTILLEKRCVHMPCSLNDRNYLILQLLQVPLASYDDVHKDQSSKPLLADCTPHGTFCRMKWCLHESVWIFRGPEPCVLLVHEPIEVEMGYITKPQAA